MSTHLTEEEQVEAIKQWWKENGVSVIGGAVIGLAAVFGWRWWGTYQTGLADQASEQFQSLHQAVVSKSPDAPKFGDKLFAEHSGSIYAVFAALDLAKFQIESGNLQTARTHLEWALTHADTAPIQQIARLRLGRLLVDMNELAAAEKVIAEAGQTPFAGDFAELRGDVARARNDYAAARQAYQDALAKGVGVSSLVRMKLDDLGGSDA